MWHEKQLPDGRWVFCQMLVMGTGRISVTGDDNQMNIVDVW